MFAAPIETKPEIESLKFHDAKRPGEKGRAAVTRPVECVTTAARSPRGPLSVPGSQICPLVPAPPQVDDDDDDDDGSDQQPHLDSLMREQREETSC